MQIDGQLGERTERASHFTLFDHVRALFMRKRGAAYWLFFTLIWQRSADKYWEQKIHPSFGFAHQDKRFEEIRFSLRTGTLSIERFLIERFWSNALDQTLSIEPFWSNAFHRMLSIKRFPSNAFHRMLSIERFPSNAFKLMDSWQKCDLIKEKLTLVVDRFSMAPFSMVQLCHCH